MMEEAQQLQASHREELGKEHALKRELQQSVVTCKQQNEDDHKRILELESNQRELMEKLHVVEARQERNKMELQNLRSENQDGGTIRFNQEKEVGESRLRIATLQQQVEDKDSMIESMKELLETTGEQKAANESSLEMCPR